jgi:threonine dehydrogenase-like Zn-dependent dehydrogenase
LAGICGTDLELANGYYPFCGIPGHEFVGEIIQARTAPQRIGQRVVGDINITCGQCSECRSGRHSHCQQRNVLGIKNQHGAFADYLCLPLRNLIPVPEKVSDDAAVFTEPLAAALRIQQQIQIGSADRVVHSATKYLGGHADALGGAVCGPQNLIDRIFHYREINGATLDPMAA